MAVRAGIIECPDCNAHLQDTRQEYMTCHKCGNRFNRATVAKEKEGAVRRKMILDLSDSTKKMKVIGMYGKMFGAFFIILGIIWLFSEIFGLVEIILTVVFFVNGIAWIGIGLSYGSKLEKTQSKLFDLTGGRAMFDY